MRGISGLPRNFIWHTSKLCSTMAEYTMQEMNDLNNEGKTLLHPRMIIRHCCDSDELSALTAEGTTFSAGEVRGVMHLLFRMMARRMADGCSVSIDGVGVFSPRLALKEGREREQTDGQGRRRNAASIEVGGISFRPDRKLLDEVNSHCRLERSPQRFVRHRSKYSPQERLALAQRYLESHPVLTVAGYVELTGLSRTVASMELRSWLTLPGSGIGSSGRGSHRVYVKKREE